jgi:hypothetical protein
VFVPDEASAKSTLPRSFPVDKEGVVRFEHAGYHDREEVEIEKKVKKLLGP